MKVALYARISTKNQDLESQEETLIDWAEENDYQYELFSEQVSSVSERPKFEHLMSNAEDYDAIAVRDLDRFGRSTRDILDKIDLLMEKNVGFRCLDQPILNVDPGDEPTPIEEAVRELMSVFASFERKMIRKRMERGYKDAVERGDVGRPRALNRKQEEYVWNKYESGYSYNTIKALVNDKFDKDISKAPIQRVIEERRGDK